MLALALAGGLGLSDAARLANAAAGIVVGKVGTAVATPNEIAAAIGVRKAEKVLSREDLSEQTAWWRLQGKRVVFTNGCYDIVHAGHLSLLREAADLGDVLVVGVNSDASVRRLKGAGRPLVGESERAELLAAFECVDAVTIFNEDTPLALLERILPDVLVKGADYALHEVVGREIVERHGGTVRLLPLLEGRSTSDLVKRIRGRQE